MSAPVAGFPTELETARLLLRGWREADLAPFAALNADPQVTRHLSGRPLTREQSDELARRIHAHWGTHGFGLWAVERKADGRMIGFAGLAVPAFLPAVLPAVEVGWRLARDAWGHGLATEAGAVGVEQAFGALRLDRVISIIRPANVASRRVAEKLGLTLERELPHPAGGDVCVYTRPAPAQRYPNGFTR
jgi:RimJ/RimL family protein N-acetyltransferase